MEPKSFLSKILECAIIIAISAYLIRLAVCYITQVWPALVIIGVIAIATVVGYRIWKRKRDSNW